ncbi:ankyrin-2 [Fusarium heterosporum]|uniref:Ankyrin-2 n=1 Tax=Fusarium heterosporum TaxID=42747 RepID=A0A8H5TC56_FUSHE|nr:ankyrin-2 [Fusarium heterosporum]
MNDSYIYINSTQCLEELPTEIKGLILDEVSSPEEPFNGYKALLNVALTCKKLSGHALVKLYSKDTRESLKLDHDSDSPLALQWACWYGVSEAAKLSLASLDRIGLDVKRKIEQPFNNGNLYELRYQASRSRGRPDSTTYGYVHWGTKSGLLHLACLRGNTAILELLMGYGVDLNTPDGAKLPPLAYTLNEDVAKLLVENGADINITHGTDETALCNLISLGSAGSQSCIKEFNLPGGKGALKALDTRHDYLSTIQYLIQDAKADIYANKIRHVNPLLKAVQTRYPEAVRLLLEAGASPNPIDTETGQKRLLLADAMKRSENHCVVKMLLEAGAEADLDQLPERGLTRREGDGLPIMHLTTPNSNPLYAREEVDMARSVCKKIKNFDQAIDGHPALWHYVRKGRQDIGRLLIEYGASPELANVNVNDNDLGLVSLDAATGKHTVSASVTPTDDIANIHNMVYLKTSQEWLDQSMALLEARPSTTLITTTYKLRPGPLRPDADGDTAVTKPPRGALVLKAYDPISGATIKYRTSKAQEVSRLMHASLGRLGRRMAAVPDVPEVTMADGEGATPAEDAQAAAPTPQTSQGGGGKKKKKGKK